MEKKYQSPIVEVLSFEKEDIVTASITLNGVDNGDGTYSVRDLLNGDWSQYL